jgi:hypothetical protein
VADPLSVFAAVAAAHALAVASPGPDFVMVSRQTLAHGRAAGLRTALGIGSAIFIHAGYSLFGLAWAIHQYPPLLGVLRTVGAALLIWIGWNALRARPADIADAPPAAHAASRDFGIGFLTNALNVKAMLFFVALGSAVVGWRLGEPARGPGRLDGLCHHRLVQLPRLDPGPPARAPAPARLEPLDRARHGRDPAGAGRGHAGAGAGWLRQGGRRARRGRCGVKWRPRLPHGCNA